MNAEVRQTKRLRRKTLNLRRSEPFCCAKRQWVEGGEWGVMSDCERRSRRVSPTTPHPPPPTALAPKPYPTPGRECLPPGPAFHTFPPPMAAPADLSKLRIDRGAPPAPVKRALGRNLLLFGAAVLVVAVTLVVLRARAVPTVQVVTATASGSGPGGSAAGATSVTANGYVVARTKASVSAKT